MKRFALLLISSCAVFFATAQEEIFLDSLSKKPSGLPIRQPITELDMDFGETAFPSEFNSLNLLLFDQPLLPVYNKNLDFLKYLTPSEPISHSFSFAGSAFSSVFPLAHVFNQSILRINDRFLFGGNSFGAQSVFDQPKLNPGIQDLGIRGASMFMQYKVNDNFKVQTRISISNRGSAPWEP